MEYKKLDKKVITSWRIGRMVFLVILAVLILGVNLATRSAEDWETYKPIFFAVEGALLLYALISLLLYPVIEYRQWGYYIDNEKVEIRHGIFFITTSVIPVIRIQHITISSGPIYRKLGLTKLVIHTASDEFTIEGLTEETAGEISENLKNKLIQKSGKAGS
ncbi:MAG TPA: PH domain-containing protein [Bacillota bacterium]|nr:PH domain-containing protein [Bacillota bacterium]HOK68201.1 PH domain-containing protein [Bacillota bacterium]HPP85000.1 PH domain-containing protein [Bacillota bacterium]